MLFSAYLYNGILHSDEKRMTYNMNVFCKYCRANQIRHKTHTLCDFIYAKLICGNRGQDSPSEWMVVMVRYKVGAFYFLILGGDYKI